MTAKKGKAKAPPATDTNGTAKHETCTWCDGARVVGGEDCKECSGTGYAPVAIIPAYGIPAAEPPIAAQRATASAEAAAAARSTDTLVFVPVRDAIAMRLDEDERNDSARRAIALHGERNRIALEFTKVTSEHRKRVREVETKIHEAMHEANEGSGIRWVDAQRAFDLKGKRSWLEHEGRRYVEREMSDEECDAFASRNMFGDPPIIPPPPVDESKPKRKASAPTIKVVSAFDHEAAERASGAKLGGSSSADIADVMRSEKSVRGKQDHSL